MTFQIPIVIFLTTFRQLAVIFPTSFAGLVPRAQCTGKVIGNFCFCLKMGDSDKIGKTLLGESVILQTYNLGDSVKIIIFALENKIVYDLQEKTL